MMETSKYLKQWVFGREVSNRDMSNDYPTAGRNIKLTALGVGRKLSVGENPLNRKELPLTCSGEGEEIVWTHMKI